MFRRIKTKITKDVTITLPNKNHPVFTVACFLMDRACVLFQMSNKGKMDVFSYNSRLVATNEQKLCTTSREVIGIVFSLTINEQNVSGSAPLNTASNDHNPIPGCFSKKHNLSSIFFTAQLKLAKPQKFLIVCMRKTIFGIVILSPSFPGKELHLNQIRHKKLLP